MAPYLKDLLGRVLRTASTQTLHDMRAYVFLDECGVTTALLRRYRPQPRGTRVPDHTP